MPRIPAGMYFGVCMVSWVVAALAETHLVDPECRPLAWLDPSFALAYGDVCRGFECVVLAVGVFAVVAVPMVMLCARRSRAFRKMLLLGLVCVVASIAFSFLTEHMLFVVSLAVDNAREDEMSRAEIERFAK